MCSLSLIFWYEGPLWILSSLLHSTSVTCLHQAWDHTEAGRWCPTEADGIRKLSCFFCFRFNLRRDGSEQKSSHYSVVLSEHWTTARLVVLSGTSMFRLTSCWPQRSQQKEDSWLFLYDEIFIFINLMKRIQQEWRNLIKCGMEAVKCHEWNQYVFTCFLVKKKLKNLFKFDIMR